jgi:hypothetical protein
MSGEARVTAKERAERHEPGRCAQGRGSVGARCGRGGALRGSVTGLGAAVEPRRA